MNGRKNTPPTPTIIEQKRNGHRPKVLKTSVYDYFQYQTTARTINKRVLLLLPRNPRKSSPIRLIPKDILNLRRRQRLSGSFPAPSPPIQPRLVAEPLLDLFLPDVHPLGHIEPFEPPGIRLHANAVVLMLLQETQPDPDRLLVPVLDLYQAAGGDALKVLLCFLEDEGVARNGPALGDAR